MTRLIGNEMTRIVRVLLTAIPQPWRGSVERDLIEEAARAGRRGLTRELWLAWQVLRVALRFRQRAWMMAGPGERRRTMMGSLSADVRSAMRALITQPGSSAAIVLTLALGLGVTTAVYAMFNVVLFRPVPGVVELDRLVSLYIQENPATPSRAGATFDHLRAMRTGTPAMSAVAAGMLRDMTFSPDADTPPRTLGVTQVTAGYFDALGVRPRIGRLFASGEYEAPGMLIAVLGERLWAREFDRDPAVVGRQVRINGQLFEVVGVADRFQGPDVLGRDEIWIPFGARRAIDPSWTPEDDNWVSHAMIARLAPGATLEGAQAQALAAFRGVGPVIIQSKSFEPVLFPGLQDGIGLTRSRLLRVYQILLTGGLLLLGLACANAANLLLSRYTRRHRDIAVRRALGASSSRIVKQLLVESGLLALGSGALALAIAAGLLGLFKGMRLLSYLPVLDDLALDWRVVSFGFGVAAATIVLFAVVPALMASRADPNRHLRESSRTTASSGWPRLILVSAQVALSLTLLVSCGLLARTVQNLRTLDLGFDPDGVFSFALAPNRLGYDDKKSAEIFRQVHERLAVAPGIAAAAVAWQGPLGVASGQRIRRVDQAADADQRIIAHAVAGGYFDVLRLPILAGRPFTPAEDAQATPTPGAPVVVNAALARALFGEANALGQTVIVTARRPVPRTVVGIVGNARTREIRDAPGPMLYEPSGYAYRIGTVLMRTALPPSAAAALARQIVAEVDPAVPPGVVATIGEQVDVLISEERVLARLGLVLAVCAALLAAAGLAAVVAFHVGERTREFGIRLALGGRPMTVIRTALGRTMRATGVGLVIGMAPALIASRLLEERLFGIDPADAVTWIAAIVLLTSSAIAAAWLPARRAARINPTIALKSE